VKAVNALLDSILAQAVSIFDTVREIVDAMPAEFPEELGQKCGGGHAVYIVIAENDEAFLMFVCAEQAFDRRFHVWQQKGVTEVGEPRFEIG
jgi:hypothetical protein